jgi:phenylacetate-CoA ligase
MNLGSAIRRRSYWLLDHIKGRPVGRHVDDLRHAFEHPEDAMARAQRRAQKLIQHAVTTTPYYAQFSGARNLEEFPILEKRTVRDRYDEFLSSAYTPHDITVRSTTGSLGMPLPFRLSLEKTARQRAELIYFGEWSGYRVGDRHVYFSAIVRKTWLQQLQQNEVLMNPARIDSAWLIKQREVLLSSPFTALIGYPSAISALVEFCHSRGDSGSSFRIGAVIAAGETLSDSLRQQVREVFGCPALSRYTTQESGVLAQECRHAFAHHLNIASYITEVVALDKDRPTRSGEMGRVIVTDLFSHAMPLIRYDTGDLAILGDGCSCGRQGPIFRSLEGRAAEIVTSVDGSLISSRAIAFNVRQTGGIKQYQFAQRSADSYEIKIVVKEGFEGENALRQRLHHLLGTDAKIVIRQVLDIPPLPSGKRSEVINEWRRAQLA